LFQDNLSHFLFSTSNRPLDRKLISLTQVLNRQCLKLPQKACVSELDIQRTGSVQLELVQKTKVPLSKFASITNIIIIFIMAMLQMLSTQKEGHCAFLICPTLVSWLRAWCTMGYLGREFEVLAYKLGVDPQPSWFCRPSEWVGSGLGISGGGCPGSRLFVCCALTPELSTYLEFCHVPFCHFFY
jgi:hypothetical protein